MSSWFTEGRDHIRTAIAWLYFRARSLFAVIQDVYYGIRTESVEPFVLRGLCKDGVRYEPTPYWVLQLVIKQMKPGPYDVVFDIGCGKGRALAVFARYRVRRVVGIEIDPALAQHAAKNALTARSCRSHIEVINRNAADVDFDSGTIFFLFNPFGAETLKLVVARIINSLTQHPRQIRIAYYNPRHAEFLADCPELKTSIWERRLLLRRPKRVLFAVSRLQ